MARKQTFSLELEKAVKLSPVASCFLGNRSDNVWNIVQRLQANPSKNISPCTGA